MIKHIPEELKDKAGVYQIFNLVNQKSYIGSTKLFRLRYQKHKFELSTNRHPNKHLLQSYQKYGEENFIFRIIYVHERLNGENEMQFLQRLLTIENELITKHQANNNQFGYNLRISADSNYGITHSDDALTRVKGKKLSKTTRQKMSASRTGEKHHSTTINEKIAKEIKMLIMLGYRNQNIASHFGISKSIVNDIKNNGAWKHIRIKKADISNYLPPGDSFRQSRLNDSDIVVLKLLIEQVVRPIVIADFLNIKPRAVSDTKAGKTYTHIVLTDADRLKYSRIIDFDELKHIEQKRHSRNREIRKAIAKKGSSNSTSKLNEEQVLEVRELILAETLLTDIANRYGVSMHAISKIKSGDNWGHLTGFEKKRTGLPKGEKHPNFKHSKETVQKVLSMSNDGYTTKAICEVLGLEKTFVNRVKSGKIIRV